MAIIRKKLLEKPAPGAKAMGMNPSGKGKPASKKPAEKPAGKHAVVKPTAKPVAKAPVAKAQTAKPASGAPAAKVPKAPPILNKGALAAKEAAAKRAAEVARIAAEKAEAEAKRPRKLVPATANAIRPGATKQTTAKGKSPQRPPAEVRPLGVLPPESMAKTTKSPAQGFRPSAPLAPVRPGPSNVRPDPGPSQKTSAGQPVRARGDER